MKKIFVFLLTVIILLGMCSCGETTQFGTNPNSSKTNESDITENNKDPNNNDIGSDEQINKENLSNVVISTEIKSHNYYSIINDESIDIPFPNKYGSYLKIISSKEEFSCFSDYEIDDSIFDDNYIIAINVYDLWDDEALKSAGFYNLKCINSEYFINVDYYASNDYCSKIDAQTEFYYIKLLVINKREIDYVSEIKNITINHKKLKSERVDFLRTTDKTPLESYSYVHVIKSIEENNELEERLFLYDSIYKNKNYVLLYMPDLNQSDFILSEKKIVDGNLYLTIVKFPMNTNTLLTDYNTNFCKIDADAYVSGGESKVDFNDLQENFKIYITIHIVNVNID